MDSMYNIYIYIYIFIGQPIIRRTTHILYCHLDKLYAKRLLSRNFKYAIQLPDGQQKKVYCYGCGYFVDPKTKEIKPCYGPDSMKRTGGELYTYFARKTHMEKDDYHKIIQKLVLYVYIYIICILAQKCILFYVVIPILIYHNVPI